MKLFRKRKTNSPFDELKRLFNDDNLNIFDVGAHMGETSLLFNELFPKAKIFSFEPFERSFEEMRKKVQNIKNIRAFNYGLSNFSGTTLLNSNKSSATNSLLETDERYENSWGKGLLSTVEKVQTHFKTFDAVVEEQKINKVQILKLDVQGAEHYVIDGAKHSIKQGIVDVIYTEIITQPTYKGQKRFDEILKLYYDLGYQVHNLYNFHYTPEKSLKQIDAIFIRNNFITK